MLSQNSLKTYHKMQIDPERLTPAVIFKNRHIFVESKGSLAVMFSPKLTIEQVQVVVVAILYTTKEKFSYHMTLTKQIVQCD